MSYNRINWKDHVVTRPRTYKEAANSDGSKTFTPAPGEILQQGTPQSATNFNAMDEAIQHIAIAYDELLCTTQAEMRAMREELDVLKAQSAALVSTGTEG